MKPFTFEHSFYCIQCGNRGIPILRRNSRRTEKFHRKKLYCIYCKIPINHIECKDMEEVKVFKKKFKRGEYLDEVKSFMDNVRGTR
jgi:hypothetical protein